MAQLHGGAWDGKEVIVPVGTETLEVPYLNIYANINDSNPVEMILYRLIDGKWIAQ